MEVLILGVGGSGLPPSPPDPSPPPSGGESSDEDSSSSEQSQTSNNSQTSAQMANQNNLARPWLDQDVVVYQDPNILYLSILKNGYPSLILDSKQSVEDHIKKFMLVVRLRNVEHEDVVCRLFPYTFEGNASTWYFAQQPQTIVSWDRFETFFLEKFGDDKSPEVLVMELSNMKMNPKEKVKDFNQRFLTLKNKIPADSMPAENMIVAYYAKALHHTTTMWVKRSKKNTLLEAFEEAVLIEKDMLSLKDNTNPETESTSSSKKKIEILTKPPSNKKDQEPIDMESLQKSFQKLSNQVVDLKRVAEEGSSSKGTYRPPFRRPLPNPPNRSTPLAEGLSLEGLYHAMQSLLTGVDNTSDVPPEQQNDVENEDEGTPNEEDSSPPSFRHFSDNIFQANFETVHNNQHPYNTRSKNQPKDQNKSAPDTNKNATSKQTKQVETSKSFSFSDIEYDPIEDFKRLKENISIYELLKFPYIQWKMLQSIAENSSNKKKDSLDKSTAEISSNKKKDVLDKSVPENNNKKKDVQIKA
jgi:hypothetical protein